MFRGGEGSTRFNGQVAGDADQATQFAKSKGKFASASSSALCLTKNHGDGALVEVRDFSNGVLVSKHLLSDEPNQPTAVS